MGDHGITGGGRYTQRIRTARHSLPVGNGKARWTLGRRPVHGHRLPTSVLPCLPSVSRLLPADRAVNVRTRFFSVVSRGKRGIRKRVGSAAGEGACGPREIWSHSRPRLCKKNLGRLRFAGTNFTDVD